MYRTAEEQSKAAIEAARRDAELQRQLTETEIAKREAERKLIAAQAEAQSQRMAGLTEAEIMQAKGYNQKDVLQAEVQKAYAEGIGNMGGGVSVGGGSVVGDMMSLGVGMAAMNTMMPQISSMMQGMNRQNDQPAPATPVSGGWDCVCGAKNIRSRFCPDCGAKKPELKAGWDCPECGTKNIASKFCPNCGCKQPEAPAGWDCPECGAKNILSKFCPDCGHKREG